MAPALDEYLDKYPPPDVSPYVSLSLVVFSRCLRLFPAYNKLQTVFSLVQVHEKAHSLLCNISENNLATASPPTVTPTSLSH